MSGYVPVAIFAALIVAFGVGSLAIAWLLRPSRPDIVKLMNYECGAEPFGPAWVRFPVGFYLVALVFSILANNFETPAAAITDAADKIVVRLATFSR